MSIKMKGREYNAYMKSEDPAFWPEGAYCDDEVVTINGKPFEFDVDVSDDADVVLEGGVFFPSADGDEGKSLEAHFKRWRKAQTHKTATIEYHRDDEARVLEALSVISAIKILR